MKTKGSWGWLGLAILILVLGMGQMLLSTSVAEGRELPLAAVEGGRHAAQPILDSGNPTLQAPPAGSELSSQVSVSGDDAQEPRSIRQGVIEVFTNTWSYSTIGLVYDPGRGHVRYAHESQSSTHNPTIYDVDYAVSHTLVYSFALSSLNSGWPWQIDNCTGAGYDFVADTYFLPDYNGDLSYADDNIVEVNALGQILNAWEMDDEVGSNDSADGSEIDNIIDIAVVPGTPPRYFATAAYDGNVVYEIALTKTGAWWTPNSWHTVATYTVPFLPLVDDNLGIDWDAEHEVLFHSSWDTTTLVITDLSMNPIVNVDATFDCPGAGGYNTGVTYIEGSQPTEVWVTDFGSDKTTRCQTPFTPETPPTGWAKWVEGQPWAPDLVISTQTEQVIQVTDIVTAVEAFTLTESWDASRLSLVDVAVFPPVGAVSTADGSFEIVVPAGPPDVVNISKWFLVEPCDWMTTTLEEALSVEGEPPFAPRPVTITKQAPALWIASGYEPEVRAGSIVSFTLSYSNTGGFENEAWISNTFPIEAPFVYAEPYPEEVGPDGLWARWDLGSLAQGDAGRIDVYVLIDETVPNSSTITIWDGIFDHVGVLRDETWIDFHANQEAFSLGWEKLVNGVPWYPGLSITLETSQMLVVEEVIFVPPLDGFTLIEEWNPEELFLLDTWTVEPSSPALEFTVVMPNPGVWSLEALSLDPVNPQVMTITKEFHVEPCTWPETILWETLLGGVEGVRTRPVIVRKRQPELWIDSFFDVSVYGGDEAEFVLDYGNVGGFESRAWISNTFPAGAPFVASDPPPTDADPDGRWAWWDVGPLADGDGGSISVTVGIARGLPPSTTVEIWDGIFNHVDELAAETWINYHVPPPVWNKWVNGVSWTPGLGVGVETSDTITVTDVISTRSGVAMVEHWNPDHLALAGYSLEPQAGIVLSDAGFLSWEFPEGAPGVMTITKVYHVEPCTWTYTVLWEELWVEGVEWERRPLHIDKLPSDLWIDSASDPEIVAGQEATFILNYGNVGGFESRAWISNTFPAEALFVASDPPPSGADPDGRWAWWDVGALAGGDGGSISVTVGIAPGLPPSTTIEIWDGIYNHVDELVGETWINYHVPPPVWNKWVDGVSWTPGLGVGVETSDTITVADVISTGSAVALVEHWNALHLALEGYSLEPQSGIVLSDAGFLSWEFPGGAPGVMTITKVYHVEPCTWTYTLLWEELWVDGVEWEQRPVDIDKLPSDLWIDSAYDPEIVAGQEAAFILNYGNVGGFESRAWISNTFPAEAPFVASDPPPSGVDPDGRWAWWDVGALAMNDEGTIVVTVAIDASVPPDTPVQIYDYVYDHADIERGWTVITYTYMPGGRLFYLPVVLRNAQP
jgi:hypothetical protein